MLNQTTAQRDRIIEKIAVADGCWHWRGRIHKGYGYFSYTTGSRLDGTRRTHSDPAHRVVYELLVGPIPPGFTLDHICHNQDAACAGGETCPHRRCVNPAHLEPVTQEANFQRAVEHGPWLRREQPAWPACARGHELTDENTRTTGGKKRCRACDRDRVRARRATVAAA